MGVLKNSIIAAAIVFPAASSADMISDGFNSSFVRVSPGHFESQTRSGYTGGSMRLRWGDTGTVTLVNITPPRMSVGCDGIDIGFGSFSFLDPDVFVDKAKAIASAAPAFAFKMALSTLCKDCDKAMQDLEAALNAINSISMDSCGIAQNLGNPAGDWLGRQIGENTLTGAMNDFASATRSAFSNPDGTKGEWFQTLAGWAGGDIIKADKMALRGSLIRNVVNGYDGFMSTNKMATESILITIFGDLYGYDAGEIHTYPTNASAAGELMLYLMRGDNGTTTKVPRLGMDVRNANNSLQKPSYTSISINSILPTSINQLVRDKVWGIRDKIEGNQALTPSDIEFLDSLDMPLWKALNAEIYKAKIGSGGSIVSDEVIDRIAYEQTKSFLLYLSGKLSAALPMIDAAKAGGAASENSEEALRNYKDNMIQNQKLLLAMLDAMKVEMNDKNNLSKIMVQWEKDFRAEAAARFSGRGW